MKEFHVLTGTFLQERAMPGVETLDRMWDIVSNVPLTALTWSPAPFHIFLSLQSILFDMFLKTTGLVGHFPKPTECMVVRPAAARRCFRKLKIVNMWTHATLMCTRSMSSNADKHVQRMLVCRTAENVFRVNFLLSCICFCFFFFFLTADNFETLRLLFTLESFVKDKDKDTRSEENMLEA